MEHTIAAISTSIVSSGAINIVRLSGKDAIEIADKVFVSKKGIKLSEVNSHTVHYGNIVNKDNIVDEVLVVVMKAPNTYTKEDVVEIDCHGGILVTKKVLETLLDFGAVLAEPGEFTKRAFLNGRMDLSQAEAVIDVINAKTQKESKVSIQQLEGGVSREIRKIRDLLMQIMVDVEVSIDYPEYDIEEVDKKKAENTLKQVEQELVKLKNSFETGKIVKEGIGVALVGKPNAGKSSL